MAQQELLSQELIKNDLETKVESFPEYASWKDFYEGGAGQTIIELLAAVASMFNHTSAVNQREKALSRAQLRSSIIELAINKDVFMTPAKSWILRCTYTADEQAVVLNAQEDLGVTGGYNVYLLRIVEGEEYLSSISLAKGESCTIDVCLGTKTTLVCSPTADDDFYVKLFSMTDNYLSEEFEELAVDGVVQTIVNGPLHAYDEELTTSVLRIPYDRQVKLVFGNDILGKKVTHLNEVSYTYLSFSEDLLTFEYTENSIQTVMNTIDFVSIVRYPCGYIDKHNLRYTAMRNSPDGRVVTTEDFMSYLLSEYYSYFYDIFVDDTFAEDNIYLLPNETYTAEILTELQASVAKLREVAVMLNYTLLDDTYKTDSDWSFEVEYTGSAVASEINDVIINWKNSYLNKISKTAYTVDTVDLCIKLTEAISNGRFNPKTVSTFSMTKLEYVDTIAISYTTVV